MVAKIRERVKNNPEIWAYVVDGLVAALALVAELLRKRARDAAED